MLALYLRCAVYLRKQVGEEMQKHIPATLQSDSLVPKLGYMQRILDYAFGAQGDIIIRDDHIEKPDGEKFNKEAEIIDYYSKHLAQTQNQGRTNSQSKRMR